ncbi:hypothetical protein [Burkholderia gladioli]|uniref:hypothetical protein n=1 Tax=Burkholderia gladioli TaxID=28095 RepID=UPI00164211B6|nr:hypothetical protein [Burkholderia gladioli]
MSRLGIDRNTGLVYEGRSAAVHLTVPTPVVSQATLIETTDDLSTIPASFDAFPFGWLFREESFDPVSRVRRGRLFQKFGNTGWEQTLVNAHAVAEMAGMRTDGRVNRELGIYIEASSLLCRSSRGEGLRLALGVANAYSLWRIVQTEQTVNADVLVTLRAESAFGILPEIEMTKISPEFASGVKDAIGRVLNAAYRELPTSVVDQCRNACAYVISRWLHQQGVSETVLSKDLGKCITSVKQHFDEQKKDSTTLCSALQLVNRLHPRGKENEREHLELRPVSEDDADLAVHALAFVVREIGWAKA